MATLDGSGKDVSFQIFLSVLLYVAFGLSPLHHQLLSFLKILSIDNGGVAIFHVVQLPQRYQQTQHRAISLQGSSKKEPLIGQ